MQSGSTRSIIQPPYSKANCSPIRSAVLGATRVVALPLALGIAVLFAVPAHAATVNHTWAITGTGDFGVAANWNPATVPTYVNAQTNDNADITNGGTSTITSNQSTFDCNATNGTYTQTGANTTLTVNSWFRYGNVANGTGNFNLNGGIVNIGTTQGGSNINIGESGKGNLNISAGSFNDTASSILQVGRDNGSEGTVAISGGTFNNTSSGSASFGTITGAKGTLTLSGTGAYIGTNAAQILYIGKGGAGTLNMQGGTLTNAGVVVMGGGPGGSGTATVSGGTMNLNAGGAAFQVGSGTGTGTSTGNLTQTGGDVKIAAELWVGNNPGSTGVYTTSAGTLTTGSWIAIGRANSTGTLNISGTSVVTKNTASGNITIGTDPNGVGNINQTGGTFTNTASQTWIGETGTGNYNISGGTANFAVLTTGQGVGGGGTITLQNGTGNTGTLPNGGGNGSVTATSVTLGVATGTKAQTLNLNGGTLTTGSVTGGASTGTKTLNFNGGTLKANTSSATFISGITTNLGVGGAIIDTNGFNDTIVPVLARTPGANSDGGLTKLGAGTLTSAKANTYGGPTTISAGILAIDHSGTNLGALGNTATTVGVNGTLLIKGTTSIGNAAGGTLTLAGGASAAPQGTLDLRDATINTLTVPGNLTLGDANGGSALGFEIGSTDGTSDKISVGGTVSETGVTTINVKNLSSVAAGTSNYVLISAPAGGINPSAFALGTQPAGFNSYSFANSTSTQLILTITANPSVPTIYWTGLASSTGSPPDPNNNWGYGATLATPKSNWSSDQAGTLDAMQVPGANSDTFFTANNASSNNGALNTQLDGIYFVKSLNFDTSATTTPISSVLINTNGNPVNIGAGGLQVLASDTSSTTISGTGSVGVAANQNWANNSNLVPLAISSGITGTPGTPILSLNGTGTGGVTLSGVISNGSATGLGLNLSQAGLTQISGVNTFTGGTTIGSGTVQTGNVAAFGTLPAAGLSFAPNSTGLLQLSGTNLSVSDLNTNTAVGTPIIQNGGATTASALTVNTANADTFAGTLQDGGAGTFGLAKAGAGSLMLTGNNTYTGGTTFTAGVLNAGSTQNGTTSGPFGGSGTLNFAGVGTVPGILQYSAANQFDYSPRFSTANNQQIGIDTNGQSVAFATGLTSTGGNLSKFGAGTLTLNGATNALSSFFPKGGTTILATGTSMTTSGYSSIGVLAGDNATLNLEGTANLTVNGDFNVSDLTGSTGVLNLNGTGTVKGANVYIGKGGNSVGTVNQSGGTFQQTGTTDFRIGGGGGIADAASVGTYNLSGGSLIAGGNLQIGAFGMGTLIQTGGTITATGGVTEGANNGSTGTFNLNTGGLLNTKFVQKGGGTGTFNFNGGTLQANAATGATFMTGVTGNISSNGAVVDTNNFANTIASVLTGAGGITKIGAGTLSLTGLNTYSGNNLVNVGTLSGTTDGIKNDTVTSAGTALDFTQGTTGTYAGTVSGPGALSKNGAGLVALSGTNTYTGPTTIGAGILSVATLPNGGVVGPLGQSSSDAANLIFGGGTGTSNGLPIGSGTLQYTGATTSTDRSFTIPAGGFANFDVVTAGTNLTLAGSIPATTGGLTKVGLTDGTNANGAIPAKAATPVGTLTLSGTNAFSGPVNIISGALVITNSSALGTGTKAVNVSAGTAGNPQLRLNGAGGNIDLPATFTYNTSNSAGTIFNDAGTNSIGGQINMITGGGGTTITSNAGTLTVSANATASVANTPRSLILQGAGNGSFTGIISQGAGVDVTKAGTGTWTLSGNNTYTGATTVSAGILQLGAADRIANTSPLVLGGGTFNTAGFSETLGALSDSASSNLDMGAGASILKFSNAGTLTGTVSVLNYSGTSAGGGTDQLFVGTGQTLTVTQLAQIKFVNPYGQSGTLPAIQLSTGELVPGGVSGATSGVVISEFRPSGPQGTLDEFVELANTSATAIDLSGWTLTAGGALLTIPSGKIIPAGGHFLITNAGSGGTATDGYSLTSVAGSDASYTGDIDPTSTLTLKAADGATVVDTVSNLSGTTPTSSTSQYSYLRRLESGVPAKTGTDTTDFNLVDTSATASTTGSTGVGPMTAARLGAPGPQNTSSPIQRNGQVTFVPINAATVGTPVEGRYASKGGFLDNPNGRQTLRRTITNNTGQTVTRMRFRIVAATSGTPSASGVADLRAITSAGVTLGGAKKVLGMMLDGPSTPTVAPSGFGSTTAADGNGGGLNSSWTVDLSGTFLLADGSTATGGIPAGKGVNVEFLFGIVQNGNYRIVIDTELLP